VRVERHEGVLGDLLCLAGIVEEQPGEPDERLPVRGIQVRHGVVGRALRAAVLAHGGHCHVTLTRDLRIRLTLPPDRALSLAATAGSGRARGAELEGPVEPTPPQ
jgi:hypothetical protein